MKKKKPKPIFDKSIFWDVDFEKLDYVAKSHFIIVRVFERGDVEDIRQCRRYYGDKLIKKVLLEAKYIMPNRLHLASAVINEPIEKFRCYILKQLNPIPYPHPLIAPLETIDKIKMYSIKDIAAMKINAILGRGVKKDFWDLAELLQEFSLADIIQFHKQKFPSQMLMISIPNAIIYFEDANDSEEPLSLKGQSWNKIKEFLQQSIREFLK